LDDNFDCKGRSDGFYSKGCSQHYYGCVSETVFRMSCPPNLMFNSPAGTCEAAKDVSDCRDNTSGEEMPLAPVVSSMTQLQPSCSERPDGPYQLGHCSEDYIVCRDGTTRLASCADPLVFSPHSFQCDFRSNVLGCMKAGTMNGHKAG
ncbi:unnamed protein product, partial [Gongylonema pulchrum]|uniref:Chitin-binding type-2 domain-containing protein n=1 Tax=Gongylonema pulchrum TaxID=637853 RepID=A0A183E3M6_9BILA